MRLVLVLSLLTLGCAHAPPTKTASRCSVVTSPRDLARTRQEDRKAYLEVKQGIQKMSTVFEVVKTRVLNDRNRQPKPLSPEDTMRAQQRLEGLQKILAGETEHLDQLASGLPEEQLETIPDEIAIDPMLSTLQEMCQASEKKREAELLSTKSVVEQVLIDFRQLVEDYQLPVRLEQA